MQRSADEEVLPDFFLLIREGNYPLLSEYIRKGLLNVEKIRWSGVTLLHRAAQCGQNEICNLLVQNGADINARTTFGWYTPFHFAISSGFKDTALLLVELGADPWKLSKYGEDAFVYGSKRGFKEVSIETRSQVVKLEAIRNFSSLSIK